MINLMFKTSKNKIQWNDKKCNCVVIIYNLLGYFHVGIDIKFLPLFRMPVTVTYVWSDFQIFPSK